VTVMSNSPGRAPVQPAVLQRIREAVGERGCLTDPAEMAPLLKSWRDNWRGRVPMVVRPANTQQVAAVVRICAETGTPIVPQGGNTGLTGGGQPHDDNSEIILSTARMNQVVALDLANDTMTVEAGCILAEIQRRAAEAGRLFPLSLAAEGSCQIGGNLATNAGGTQVLRYGNARNLVLGLEVVLPDGSIWDGLRGLRKDNTGYDLKQLFIGAEGTLGIITRAVLKLHPRPGDSETMLVALPVPAAAVTLLARARAAVGEQVTTFELIQRSCLDIVLKHIPGAADPLPARHPWYALVEVAGQGGPGTLRPAVEALLAEAAEAGEVLDAVLASSQQQARALRRLREGIPEAQNHEGVSLKHDVSVPLSRIDEFIARASRQLQAAYPGIRIVAFGHIGDGNIHFNPAQPVGADRARFAAELPRVNQMVHDLVHELGGSISAEHGIGRLRREELKRYKSPVELALMGAIKRALDPGNIMNPGKLVSP